MITTSITAILGWCRAGLQFQPVNQQKTWELGTNYANVKVGCAVWETDAIFGRNILQKLPTSNLQSLLDGSLVSHGAFRSVDSTVQHIPNSDFACLLFFSVSFLKSFQEHNSRILEVSTTIFGRVKLLLPLLILKAKQSIFFSSSSSSSSHYLFFIVSRNNNGEGEAQGWQEFFCCCFLEMCWCDAPPRLPLLHLLFDHFVWALPFNF